MEVEHYVYLLSVPAVCVAEVLTIMWLYGVQRLANRLSDMTGKSESFLWKWMWKFLCPSILAVGSCWSAWVLLLVVVMVVLMLLLLLVVVVVIVMVVKWMWKFLCPSILAVR